MCDQCDYVPERHSDTAKEIRRFETDAPKAARPPALVIVNETLGQTVSELVDEVTYLEERLAPVRRLADQASPGRPYEEFGVPLADAVMMQAATVGRIVDRLRELRHSIEL